ncbi:protein Dom34p [Trichomonascus vanleenenianus]|uniref:ribosome dissociation factor DOM34 n=1 Tax=Trichomonascus vanleenenianus TaxID=2268995 RepID=UPI003ECAE9B5
MHPVALDRISIGGEGQVRILPDDKEDMWAIYNVLRVGDEVQTVTVRKVNASKDPSSKDQVRKRFRLNITVEKIEYEPSDGEIRVKGRTTDEEIAEIPTGSYQSFSLQPGSDFKLYKERWDAMDFGYLQTIGNPDAKAEVGAVAMQEGLANICLITENMTVVKRRIEVVLPRKKRGDNSGYEKGVKKFYAQVYEAMIRLLDMEKLKAIIIASPGFVARNFMDYTFQRAVDDNDKIITKNKAKFLVAHASTGHVHALNEILKDPGLQKQLSNTKYGKEVATLDKFFKSLNDDDMRAWYGPKHVAAAVEQGAVSDLLIADKLFRSDDVNTRRRYIDMVENVKNLGGEALILSSMHETGEQLNQITGIACILKYPMPELDDIEDDDSDEE